MWTIILPLISFAVSAAQPAAAMVTPRAVQVQLAETLASADAIHAVSAHGTIVSFAIDRDGESFRVEAVTHGQGEVVALTVIEAGPALGDPGSLSWLADELAQATAVTRLTVDEDGAVTIATSEGRAYMAIPGRGSGGNMAVEARWAAAWNSSDS
jgi:hypothetical protein